MKRYAKYVNHPETIPEVRERVERATIQFREKVDRRILANGFMYTTCVFCHIKKDVPCKNRREGRYQEVDCGEGKRLSYCYPELSEVKHRIQIGLHLDLEELGVEGGVRVIFPGEAPVPVRAPVQEPVHVSPPAPEPVLAQAPVWTPVLSDETITRFLSRYTIPRDMQSLVKENILLRLENSYLKSRGPDQELVANFYRGVMA